MIKKIYPDPICGQCVYFDHGKYRDATGEIQLHPSCSIKGRPKGTPCKHYVLHPFLCHLIKIEDDKEEAMERRKDGIN